MVKINSPEDFGREFEKLKRTGNIHNQIQKEHNAKTPFDSEPRPMSLEEVIERNRLIEEELLYGKPKSSVLANILLVFLFAFVVFVGAFAYYSQVFITKEYGSLDQTSVSKEIKPDLLSKKLGEHCYKLQFRSLEAARKMGC